MRLLHTKNLEFQEFYDKQIPKYAILSHRWIGNEVTYAEFHDRKARKRPEFSKVLNCCSLAKRRGIEWVWIDTCCIDKKSSAELTEAINSMYQWYERAEICYAYLADVRMVEDEHGNWEESRAEFRRSAWFTRGWTLQELLAPDDVLFLDRDWAIIGLATDTLSTWRQQFRDLGEDVSAATGITIVDLWSAQSACIARKFSWLSRRETTRIEDMAYCMLGLCDVNMPLLYGEGKKAFMRLQMEIIKSSDDESIFAWFPDFTDYYLPMLAPSPAYFAKSGSIALFLNNSALPGKLPFSITNKGLQYQVPRAEPRHNWSYGVSEKYVLLLNCVMEGKSGDVDDPKMVAITLKFKSGKWWRFGIDRIELSNRDQWTNIVESPKCTYENLYIKTLLY